MIVAIYLPDDIAVQFKADRLQDSLNRLRKFSENNYRANTVVNGEVLLISDVNLMRQLEASFCVAREVDKKGEILVDPNDPTHGDKV